MVSVKITYVAGARTLLAGGLSRLCEAELCS